jgi:hypothetical protein
MSQRDESAISLPDPESVRERIDQLDREAEFLRKLLRLLCRSAPQNASTSPTSPKLCEVSRGY